MEEQQKQDLKLETNLERDQYEQKGQLLKRKRCWWRRVKDQPCIGVYLRENRSKVPKHKIDVSTETHTQRGQAPEGYTTTHKIFYWIKNWIIMKTHDPIYRLWLGISCKDMNPSPTILPIQIKFFYKKIYKQGNFSKHETLNI